MSPSITLKAGREKSVLNRHPWIFSGGLYELPDFEAGQLVKVYASNKTLLGNAYYNKRCSLCARMISFGDQEPLVAIRNNLAQAWQLRKQLIPKATNAYRVVNAEADGLPGLVVDRYKDRLVVQSSTAGIDRLFPVIVEELQRLSGITLIFDRSTSKSRKQEGLASRAQWFEGSGLLGSADSECTIQEHGLNFIVDTITGQKTGFFLDQREMRKTVQQIAQDKRVLNCFSYSGGFSVYALAGGAVQVTSVDASAAALELARRNIELNNFDTKVAEFIESDVFDFLSDAKLTNWDLVILDPPAFAKHKEQLPQAIKGYRQLNAMALKSMPASSLLLSCSCSNVVSPELFQKIIYQAALEADRDVKIISHHHQACDHLQSIYHPEGSYLKSLLLYVV